MTEHTSSSFSARGAITRIALVLISRGDLGNCADEVVNDNDGRLWCAHRHEPSVHDADFSFVMPAPWILTLMHG
ncbi:hypothetical protein C1I98_07635 [Spongiactinospora gelatinilytica]|uniref:Uncharacterized protein n=1 Tax=Spongiactinospora gelatinilytica TaxID=2666298 RepID=A0A2W2GRC7_9ACTN|nr:hypothetical protein [Spongiactinospora gelatinilytica]PZG52086.1 hypothetical protein C1I98_07635 [Spongiactinospora gelatinilytica]